MNNKEIKKKYAEIEENFEKEHPKAFTRSLKPGENLYGEDRGYRTGTIIKAERDVGFFTADQGHQSIDAGKHPSDTLIETLGDTRIHSVSRDKKYTETYLLHAGDTLTNIDQKGKVYFEGIELKGVKSYVKMDDKRPVYEDDKFFYKQNILDMQITSKETGDTITLDNVQTWDSKEGAYGITLPYNKINDLHPDLNAKHMVVLDNTQTIAIEPNLTANIDDDNFR